MTTPAFSGVLSRRTGDPRFQLDVNADLLHRGQVSRHDGPPATVAAFGVAATAESIGRMWGGGSRHLDTIAGEFAAAIWDDRTEELLLVVDHVATRRTPTL